ncbi:MAG: hypothetical protein KAS32_26760 [Candidatus Peribacteraceae bacterium]|nr:hypothetical protein [Candidatus Peribacteraceae bacterium]
MTLKKSSKKKMTGAASSQELAFPKKIIKKAKPRYKKPLQSEDDLQGVCENYLALVARDQWIHIPDPMYRFIFNNPHFVRLMTNGMFCGMLKGVQNSFRRCNLTGFPDIAIFKPGKDGLSSLCLMIELKSEIGQLHGRQKNWANKATIHLCRTFEEFRELVDKFLEEE